MQKERLDIHVDGSCLDNGRPNARGGWGCFATYENQTDIIPSTKRLGKIREGLQTNNRAELEAVYQGLCLVEDLDDKYECTIYSDSLIVSQGIDGSVSRNANRDLWTCIENKIGPLVASGKVINVVYIESHQHESELPQHINNCICDKMAKKGANSLLLKPVTNF